MKFNFALFLCLEFIFLAACSSGQKEGNTELSRQEEIKLTQYIRQGRRLYLQHCANCHQEDGTGLGRLIPPLKGADYMAEDIQRTVCIIKNGMEGEIIVNGVQYNQPMPAVTALKNIEVAEVITYIHNTWGTKKGIVEVKEVEKMNCQ